MFVCLGCRKTFPSYAKIPTCPKCGKKDPTTPWTNSEAKAFDILAEVEDYEDTEPVLDDSGEKK